MRNLKLIELAVSSLCAVLSLLPLAATAKDDLAVPAGCEMAQTRGEASDAGSTDKAVFPPVALQIRTAVTPTAFASDGKNFLVYELQLQNFYNRAVFW